MPEPRELAEKAFTLLQEALHDSEARVAELSERLDRREAPETGLEQRVDALTLELRRVQAERDRLERDAGHLEEVVAGERARIEQLEKKLHVAESGPDKLTKQEINYWRGKAGDFDRATQSYRSRLAQLRRELAAAKREVARLEVERPAGGPPAQSELEALRAAQGELEELRAALSRSEDVVRERDNRLAEISAELEKTRAELTRKSEEITAAAARQDDAAAAQAELLEAREQIDALEAELREERECATNLTEVANERRELIRTLEDRLEEAEERYEDTKWRLGKAQHYERLVRRRKLLVGKLIEKIRAKSKANVALKAGLDGLRKHKAAAEAKQHQLLARMDRLKARISEHEETIARLQEDARATEQAAQSQSQAQAAEAQAEAAEAQARAAEAQAHVAELEQRLSSQAEVIQSLEEDLKTTRAMKQADASRRTELERLGREAEELRRELDAKNAIIEALQKDADEQLRKISKLRGSETETLRLKSAAEKNQSLLDALQRENAQLREVLERQSGQGAAAPEAYGNVAEK